MRLGAGGAAVISEEAARAAAGPALCALPVPTLRPGPWVVSPGRGGPHTEAPQSEKTKGTRPLPPCLDSEPELTSLIDSMPSGPFRASAVPGSLPAFGPES